MMEIKVGDKVRYTGDNTSPVTHGAEYEVVKLDLSGDFPICVEPSLGLHYWIHEDNFELVTVMLGLEKRTAIYYGDEELELLNVIPSSGIEVYKLKGVANYLNNKIVLYDPKKDEVLGCIDGVMFHD